MFGLAAVFLSGSVLLAVTGTSSAAPVAVTYDAKGQSTLTGLGATLPLGPGTVEAAFDLQSGQFTGQLALPESRTAFTLFGFLDTHAKVKITQAGAMSGTVTSSGAVTASVGVNVQITEVGHFGFGIPLANCKTTAVTPITLTSQGEFEPTIGGTLVGKYVLPKFADCGFDTDIINGLLGGQANSLTMSLTFKQ
ncbi:hypothetical protein [Actinokineospora xionganensis]|uniref:Polyisoprenoid-binding protein YceI n=1 Tax=Actinokineospora xionganensis TaxID=2684470 RepID=A0ABR7L4F0_9PSEU|nr:hypothetical protein [Actinokineospora xionganensis]MBC6447560.1 hypothetical protein [Actinokineospora xionganensis]